MPSHNDNQRMTGRTVFGPSRAALFLPVSVVVIGYAAFLAGLAAAGLGDGPIFRFGIAVLALGAPFLVAHAWLRAVTIRAQLLPHALFLHRGFPSLGAVELPYGEIAGLRVARGPGGRLTGSGTLIVDLVAGGSLTVCDLAEPEEARLAITALLRPASAGADMTAPGIRVAATAG